MAGIVRHDMYDYWYTQQGKLDSGDSVPSLWSHDASITLDDKVSLTKTTVQALSSDLKIPDGKSLLFGDDVGLTRGAADRLDLADGDSLNIINGALMVAGTGDVATFNQTGSGNIISGKLSGSPKFVVDKDGKLTTFGGFAAIDVNFAGGTTYKVEADGDATLKDLTVGSIAGQTISFAHTSDVATFNQTGSGNIIVGQDGGSPVFVVSEPGKLTTFGGFAAIDVNFAGGTTYKVEADGDARFKNILVGGPSNYITNFWYLRSSPASSLPHLALESTGSGDNWSDKGAIVSIGEDASNQPGAKAMNMTYEGGDPAYGYIGIGGLIPSSGKPLYYLQFRSDTWTIRTNCKLEFGGSGSYYVDIDGQTMFTHGHYVDLTVTNCISEGTCEIFHDIDALEAIKFIQQPRTGMLNEFGHEKQDMKAIHERYPFLIKKETDYPKEGQVWYGDKIGSKSDLLYVAVLQLLERIETLEKQVTTLQ